MSPQDRLWPPPTSFPGEEEPAPFDLRHTIDVVADDLTRRHVSEGLTVNVRYALGAPRFLVGYGDRIRQVMMKLVGRAAELAAFFHRHSAVSPAGRRVVIDVQGDECPDGCAAMRLRVEVASPAAAGEKVASGERVAPVGRNGELLGAARGPARVLQAVLQESGAGLGPVSTIADCRRLVELMGGRLGVLSEPGRGSFVWLAMRVPVDASRRR